MMSGIAIKMLQPNIPNPFEPLTPEYVEQVRQIINESGRAFIGESFPLEKYMLEAMALPPNTVRYEGTTPEKPKAGEPFTYDLTYRPDGF